MNVAVPRDLNDSLAAEANVWSQDAQLRIRARLQLAADAEWATRALEAFDRDPSAFLLHHFEADLEHAQTAIALYRAVEEVCNRTGTESLDAALAQLAISERDWLRDAGLNIFDHKEAS